MFITPKYKKFFSMKQHHIATMITLIVFGVNIILPPTVLSDINPPVSKQNALGITKHTLEIRSTPEIPITKKSDESWLMRYKWWVVGGLALIAGGVVYRPDASESDPTPAGSGSDDASAVISW